jgi:hypothetical protein
MLASDGTTRYCLSPTHHSHFKLLKTMKNLRATFGSTPSACLSVRQVFKGIYACVFLIFTTTLSFSQNSQWEFGVGLRPLTLKEEPYSLILKRHLSRNTAIRFGASVIFIKQNERYAKYFSFADTGYMFRYDYELIDRKFFGTAFIGFQYGKRKNNFYWYGATDFSFKYKIDGKRFSNEDYIVPSDEKISPRVPPGQLIVWADFDDIKKITYGIRQSFGLQYFVNQSVSVSLEASVFYEVNTINRQNYYAHVFRPVDIPPTTPAFGYGGGKGFLFNYDTYLLSVSPLTFLSFNYHF